jgi:hypothetical protein
MDWDDYFRQQAAMYRKLAEKAEDALLLTARLRVIRNFGAIPEL